MAVEIERKFLVEKVPAVEVLGVGTPMRQGYLAIDGEVTVRLRIMTDRAVLTIKTGGAAMGRVEVETVLPLDEAEELWPSTAGRRLEKVRYGVPLDDGAVAELDVYAGDLDGLLTVEVEFDSEDAARAFAPPAWFGRELTGDARWSNAALARSGIPR